METETKGKRGNFDLEELASIPNFLLPTLNHAKDKLAFYWNKTGIYELYVMDMDSKEITQISDGQLPKSIRAGYIWGRDNETIFFGKDNDGDEQHNIHSININTGDTEQLTDTPDAQDYVVDTSPDGKWLLFNANREATQMNVYRYHLETGKVEQITAHENPVTDASYSKNGDWIAYPSNEEGDLVNSDIYLAKPDGSEIKRVVQVKIGSKDIFSDWSEDSSFFVFNTDINGNNQVATYDLETEEITFYGDASVSENAVKMIANDKIMAIVNKDSSIAPIIYDVKTRERRELNFPPGITIGSELLSVEEVILLLNRPISPSTLVKFNLETEETEVLLETDTGNIDNSLFVSDEYIKYPSTDGTEIPAIIYKPRDFDPSRKYPAIVMPHGGPTGQYFRSFIPNIQYFADLGYVILLPNVRGSTGYGSEFRDACIKDWGGKDHEDWIAGRQWLIDNVSVDPDKVAIYGGSYGGYATLWCMGNSPDLWAAGVAWVPVSDLVSMYGESMEHFKYYLRQQMGDPQEDKELWIERSPVTHIQNMKSPLLLVHGKNDPRCPVSQSHIVVDKLKEHGYTEGEDFEYVEFGDQGHGSGDIQDKIKSLKLLDDFLYRKIEMET